MQKLMRCASKRVSEMARRSKPMEQSSSRNGPRKASLLSLPAELRIKILEYVAQERRIFVAYTPLGIKVVSHYRLQARNLLPSSMRSYFTPAAMLVCRQLFTEIKPIFLRNVTIKIQVKHYEFGVFLRFLETFSDSDRANLAMNKNITLVLQLEYCPKVSDLYEYRQWCRWRNDAREDWQKLALHYDVQLCRTPSAFAEFWARHDWQTGLVRCHLQMLVKGIAVSGHHQTASRHPSMMGIDEPDLDALDESLGKEERQMIKDFKECVQILREIGKKQQEAEDYVVTSLAV